MKDFAVGINILRCTNQTLGTLSNANDEGSEKLHFWFTLYFFVRVIWILFLCLKLCE